MTIGLALLSALAFGIGMSLQQRSARTISFEHALRSSMVRRLLVKRVWLAGIAVSGIGFLLQLAALRTGSLVTVQPIVTSALVVCLATTAWYDGEQLGKRVWAAIGVVIGGVALFIEAGASSGTATTTVAGAPLIVVTVGFVALVVMCANRARAGAGTGRAVAVGAAAGLGNAYVAVLARAGADSLRHGLGSVLRSPYPYALAVAAIVTVLLVQAIYQAGRPTLSLPLATMSEALGSVVLAITVLHEQPVLTGPRGALALLGLLAAVAGLAELSRDEARTVKLDANPHRLVQPG